MIEHIEFNKEYLKSLTPKFMDKLMSLSYYALQDDIMYLIDLDPVGIQINAISIYIGMKTFSYTLETVFVNQKTGKCESSSIDIVFAADKIESAGIYSENLSEEFLEIVPALEKNLAVQLYILKKVIEETEED